MDELLTSCLRDILVTDLDVPANYAIRTREQAERPGQPRYSVYTGCERTAITRTLERAVAIVCGNLEDHYPRVLSEDHVYLAAVCLLRGDEAVLVPWQIRQDISSIEAKLEGHGVMLLEHRSVVVDTSSSEVVVEPEKLPSVSRLGCVRSVQPWPRVQQGRYRLRAWALWEGVGGVSPGIATAQGFAAVRGEEAPERNLRLLARLATGLPLSGARSYSDVWALLRGLWI